MSSTRWDKRYAADEYVYGTNPNEFFRDELAKLSPGRILLPAEGEGRNSVYAASQGWKVTAFDSSTEGQKKALRLAGQNSVHIQYQVAGFSQVLLPEEHFDCVAMIYAHASASDRTQRHRRMLSSLKEGGTFILEGFSKEQIHNQTGGPKDVAMLFSEEELKFDFQELSERKIWKEEIELQEGPFHNGKASIIRLIGVK
ncbi:bifunctional 2-polyprenyl-6-hydroxyphenol methylase/3-demethylubiquinol 3-O-methyltransferase UbiG [Prolixibacter sp. SD074]|jgi:SAM-dependent methyltransferase|uniref:class I SAM-dependent methyltransferase n=1 Tax=Prolixibacter sp. SD074 TaxID=2652391 RepID=UPI00126E3356|nr:class I SAM-dependent methyltransferase [Prolixibacter sp. SD074]GET28381.1 methyltransferase [Prolixibacter sp. SD074]